MGQRNSAVVNLTLDQKNHLRQSLKEAETEANQRLLEHVEDVFGPMARNNEAMEKAGVPLTDDAQYYCEHLNGSWINTFSNIIDIEFDYTDQENDKSRNKAVAQAKKMVDATVRAIAAEIVRDKKPFDDVLASIDDLFVLKSSITKVDDMKAAISDLVPLVASVKKAAKAAPKKRARR
jgi:hypothetical protein